MALVPLDLPPGVASNGTDLQRTGRWIDASLVRWRMGAMGPVGGWRPREVSPAGAVTTQVVRAAIAWEDNSANRWLALGSASELCVLREDGTAFDITPTGLSAGNETAQVNIGYGGGLYGVGTYGTERADTGNYSEADTWSFALFGENLIACLTSDGKIYEWPPNVSNDAAVVASAPTDNLSVVVTQERFVVALGAGGDPQLVQWSDQEDYDTWTPSATNAAGSQRLQSFGQIMVGVPVRGQTLILTENDAHTMTFIGQPFVFGFEQVGTSCGIVSRKAVAQVEGGAFWMGQRGFFFYQGGAVEELPCDVLDDVFSTNNGRGLNTAQQSQVFCVKNSAFSEVWWFYPSSDSNDCDRYVAYNYLERHWMIGELPRTAGVDRGTFRTPIWVGTDRIVYDHEVTYTPSGDLAFAESGPVSLGDRLGTVRELIPDEVTQGQVTATFKVRNYPNADEATFGPYDMAEPTHVLFTGRQVRLRIDGDSNANWRAGVMRMEIQPRGRK